MGHEAPDRAAEVGPERRPDVVEARPVSGPTAELQTLDALAERAAKSSVDTPPSPALRASSVQRLQLRAGNAAVAAMLQRRAAPPGAARRPSPVVPRKPTTTAVASPLQRSPGGGGGGAAGALAKDGAGSAGATTEAPAATTTSDTTRTSLGGAAGFAGAAGAPPPPDGAPTVQRRPMSAILEEARKRAAAGGQPTGPEDTASVEGDTDMSDFTDKPAEARAERAANPPPKPPAPPKPSFDGQPVGAKPPPKPPAKKVGKAVVKGPKGKGPKGGAGTLGPAKPGEVVAKPAPPLPPVWKKPPPKQPVDELPAPPVEPQKVKPQQDPAFAKVVKAAGMTVKKAKKHPKGTDEAKAAQAAAVPPGNDIDAQAKANRADTMATAKPKKFDEEAFVAAVKASLAKAAPKTLNETGDVGGKAADAKAAISDKVGASKQEAAGDVAAKSQQAPDPSTATPKPVTPMAPLEIEQAGGLKASSAMPAPVPNEQIDVREGPAKVDNEMGQAGVSEEQLAKSNEPEFTGALDAKKEGEQSSAKLPGDVRKAEGAILKQAAMASAAEEKKTVGEANAQIGDTVAKVGGQKSETKSKDELKRKEVADHINAIFDKTKSDVDDILGGLDDKVNKEFETGEAEVLNIFQKDWDNRLENYKDDRYSGWRGPFRWARDKFRGLPSAAFDLFAKSRAVYENGMDKLVRRIATIVSQELTRATVRIEQGRGEVSTYVSGLKGDLAKFGEEAAKDVTDKFDNLDSSVTDKFNELADSLAKKYAESREKVNAALEKSKAENAGLIDKAIGAIKGVIDVILKLKDLVLTVLGKIRDVIGKIIDDPIGFLKNFVNAVKAGVERFAKNIGDHLQKGLMGWLFGTLDAAGIEIPDSFSIQGIMKLVMSVLGMTWQVVRERMVKKIGEPAMNALEAGADIVKKVITGGPSVLWEMLVEKFTEFEDMVIGEIKSFVMEKVVKAGITWLVSMLNPAAAFIKACKMIYDVVMFFVERGSQIKEFVETVIDAAGDIARGGAGGVPEKIEGVLAKLLPLAISFLANLLGLGGVGDKVRSIIDKVRSPIKKAMDKVIDVVVNMTAPIWKPAKKLFEKGKKLYGKAKEKAVAAYEKGKAKVKEVGGKIKDGYKKVKEKAKATAGKVIYKGQQAWQKGKQKVKGYYDAGKKKVGAAKDKVVALFKRQEKPFAMKGKSHTLIAEPGGKGFRIKMKSNEELLSSKIAASVASLKARAETETGDDKKKTESQIRELGSILDAAQKLEKEAAAAGATVIGPTGAPAGFEGKMARLAAIIADYGTSSGETDITKVDSGVQVDMALLAKFGLPVASYLQAQKAADLHGGDIQIRATNEAAPKLLEQGLLPKPEFLKMKTVNEDDVLLGVDASHLSKPALFLPRKPVREAFKTDDEFARATDRWKFRTQEYKDIMTVDKHFQGLLTENKIGFIDTAAMGAAKGGVIVDVASGLAFTGDHDLFRVTGNKSAIINELEKAPFRAQHGAHMDWVEALHKMADSAKKAHLVEIFNNVIKKHVFGPKGEALLQINKDKPPTTAHASLDNLLPPVPVDEKAEKDEVKVETAGPHGSGSTATSDAADAPEGAAVTSPVKGEGETHTVILTPGPTPKLEMASVREDMLARLERERTTFDENTPAAQKKGASELISAARALVALPEARSKKGAAKLQAATNQLANQIERYIRQWHKPDVGIAVGGGRTDEMLKKDIADEVTRIRGLLKDERKKLGKSATAREQKLHLAKIENLVDAMAGSGSAKVDARRRDLAALRREVVAYNTRFAMNLQPNPPAGQVGTVGIHQHQEDGRRGRKEESEHINARGTLAEMSTDDRDPKGKARYDKEAYKRSFTLVWSIYAADKKTHQLTGNDNEITRKSKVKGSAERSMTIQEYKLSRIEKSKEARDKSRDPRDKAITDAMINTAAEAQFHQLFELWRAEDIPKNVKNDITDFDIKEWPGAS